MKRLNLTKILLIVGLAFIFVGGAFGFFTLVESSNAWASAPNAISIDMPSYSLIIIPSLFFGFIALIIGLIRVFTRHRD